MPAGQGDWVEVRHVKKELKGGLYDLLRGYEARGWRLRRAGDKFRFYCPEASRLGCKVAVNGTPQNLDTHLMRVSNDLLRCHHEAD